MRRGARAPLFVFTQLHIKSFGFSLGTKQLHTTTTQQTHCLIKEFEL
jgi:hypothetical protein